jgi:hypothetical protein
MKPSIDSLALAGTGSGVVTGGGESEEWSCPPPQAGIKSDTTSATHIAQATDLHLVFMLLLLAFTGT